jgi:hypothetical protein
MIKETIIRDIPVMTPMDLPMTKGAFFFTKPKSIP